MKITADKKLKEIKYFKPIAFKDFRGLMWTSWEKNFFKNLEFNLDKFTFDSADIHINGTPLLENMSPTYFHTVQNYYKSKYGVTDYRVDSEDLMYTRYFVYHFGLNASDYNPSGSCNFSRLDNAKLILRGVEKGVLRGDQTDMNVFAVNYNVLRIKDGLAGILFGN